MKHDRQMTDLFAHLMSDEADEPRSRAVNALLAAAGRTEWKRNQPCHAAVSGGRIGCVVAGAVRKYALHANGQRRIVDILVPGDFIGLTRADPAFISLEAVANGTRIACFRPEQLKALSEAYSAIAALLRERACDAIRRLEAHVLIQGNNTALGKVGSYLTEMCRRLATDERGSLLLPISRYDIADHLGMAVETVSRTITTLRRDGIIELQSPRQIHIRDAPVHSDCHL